MLLTIVFPVAVPNPLLLWTFTTPLETFTTPSYVELVPLKNKVPVLSLVNPPLPVNAPLIYILVPEATPAFKL